MDKKNRKQLILEATLDVIGEQGLNGATFRAVAKRAEVPLGLTSDYYKIKEDLFLQAFQLFQERVQSSVMGLAEEVGGLFDGGGQLVPEDRKALIDQLTNITTRYIKKQVTTEAKYRRVAAAFMHAGIADPSIREHVAERQAAFIDMGSVLLSALHVENPDQASHMFLALTNHMERHLMLENKKRFNRKYVEGMLKRFFEMVIEEGNRH